MVKVIPILFIISCAATEPIPEECLQYVAEECATCETRDPDTRLEVIREIIPPPGELCGVVQFKPMCNRDGSGVFLLTDNCAIYGAMGMTSPELDFFCGGSGL